MDLTELIDLTLPRLSRQNVKKIARLSCGRPKYLRNRVLLRLAEPLLALSMRKPEMKYKRIGTETVALGYPVTYHGEHLLIKHLPGVRYVRLYVLCNTMEALLQKR